MKKIYYDLKQNDCVNHVIYADVQADRYYAVPQAFTITDLSDPNPIYPCRAQFLKEMMIDKVMIANEKFSNIWFPQGTTRIEFSNFIHQPTILSFYSMVNFVCEDEETCEFQLVATGGIKIWVNQELVEQFTPYKRNSGSTKNISLKFKKGKNELVIYCNDLAERDISFFYSLKYLGNKPLKYYISMDEDIDDINNAEKLIDSLYLEKDYFEDGSVFLYTDHKIEKKQQIEYKIYNLKRTIDLVPDEDKYYLFDIDEVESSSSTYVYLSIKIGKVELKKKLFISIYKRDKFMKYNNLSSLSYQKRKEIVINYASQSKDNCPAQAMCYLETHQTYSKRVEESVRVFIDKANRRDDCADFHICSYIMLYKKYYCLLPDFLIQDIKKMLLNFRYWSDEPGNDVMCCYSENHQLLHHASQYLAGKLFPNEVFFASKRFGCEQEVLGKFRLNCWLDRFLNNGLTEWNSNTYIPVELYGLLPLYELTDDCELKNKVKTALDYLFEIIGLNIFRGVLSSSHGRTYEKDLKVDKAIEMSFINWLAFGEGYFNDHIRITAMLALCSYVPKNYLEVYELGDDKAIVLNSIQGGLKANTYLYKTKYYSLASVLQYNVGRRGGHDQLINISLAKRNESVRFWINHPGELPVSGDGRPSYWVGCGTNPHIEQYENIIMANFKISIENDIDFIHMYFPKHQFDEVVYDKQWIFIRSDKSYCAIYFHNKYQLLNIPPVVNREIRSYGKDNKVIVKTSSFVEIGEFTNFISETKKIKITILENEMSIIDDTIGKLTLKYNIGLYLGNQLISKTTKSKLIPNIKYICPPKLSSI